MLNRTVGGSMAISTKVSGTTNTYVKEMRPRGLTSLKL
jgi:hypothetical protein